MALTDNIIHYWKFDSGDFTDSAGSLDLTNNGTTSTSGIIGDAREYNGSNQNMDSGANTSDIMNTTAFTFSGWVKITGAVVSIDRIFDFVPTGGREIKVELRSDTSPAGAVRFGWADGSSPLELDSTIAVPTDSAWHHIVCVIDNTGTKIYIDNVERGSNASMTSAAVAGSAAAYIGSSTSSSTWFDGAIDEIGLWDRRLSVSEISELYNSGNGLQYPFTGGGDTNINSIFFGNNF